MNRKPLAIVTPFIDFPTYTYIEKHVKRLFPEGTVVIAMSSGITEKISWGLNCPILKLNDIKFNPLILSLARKVDRNVEWQMVKRVLKSFLSRYGVEVVLGEFLDISLPILEVAAELKIRFYAHAHGIDVSAALRREEWRLNYLKYREANGLITVNKLSRNRLINLGLDPSKIHVIPCGVDIPDRIFKPLPGDGNSVLCVAVGRMAAKKGIILTLDAFRRATEVYDNLKLCCIGDGPLLPAAKQYVNALNLGDKVEFMGTLEHAKVRQVLDQSDIFLQHSITDTETGDEEGLPVSILEAMAHSLPVVSTLHAGIPEAVRQDNNGYLVEEGDVMGMSKYIVSLATNPSLRRKMGEEGLLIARDCFSWDKERYELSKLLGIS